MKKVKQEENFVRCEGYTKPGIFQFALQQWTQCSNKATVYITFTEQKKTHTLPACNSCWKECLDNNYKIKKVVPIN